MLRSPSAALLVAAVLLGSASLAAGAAAPSEPDAAFVDQAVGAFVAAVSQSGTDGEDLWALAAAPNLDFRAHPAALGRLWVQEVSSMSPDGSLWQRAREEAAATGETPRDAMSRLVTELARTDGRVLLRAAVRLYASLEAEPGPSRLRVYDLEVGALDAAPPAGLSVRHRSILPDGETETLVFAWPPDGGEGAAVVRYSDRALPPDVVFFEPGDRRSIPLSGVARVDFLVGGSNARVPGLRAPVDCTRDASGPFSGLEAKASAGAGGPRLTWTTASHSGLWGWAVFREEVLADGRIVRTGPELVPSSENADESFGYAFVDTTAAPGTFYRYTVWAVTDEGLLARAFAATLETGRRRRD